MKKTFPVSNKTLVYNKLPLLFLTFIFSLLFFFSPKIFSQTINYKSQSLYIYIFTKNIIWPENAIKTEFTIGVFGASPIYEELQIMASLKKAGTGHKILVRKIVNIEDIANEQIIYIASSKSRELNNLLIQIENKPILLIAEREGLAAKGAAFNFMTMEDNSLKIELNTETLRKHNLRITNELQQKAFVVK